VLGAGYRHEEFEMADVDMGRRGKLVEEHARVMLDAWTGEPFDDVIEQIGLALASTVPGILGSLADLKPSFGGL
jgi:alkanesulfonate monooxygenase SsuD/methylene tetrahydromethanopterin reductase-like flavin-dependent oxidoreductase (luciferase family)